MLEEKKTTEVKKYRNQKKSARVAEREERKHWTQRQQIVHSYGNQEDDHIGEDQDSVDSNEVLYPLIGGEHIADSDGKEHLLVLGQHTTAASVSHSAALVQPSKMERSGNHASAAPQPIPAFHFVTAH